LDERCNMKKYWMQVGLFVVLTAGAQAVVSVSNLAVTQQEGSKQMQIQYDVSSSHASAVQVDVLVFDGTNSIALSALSGDVGAGVSTGTGKTILWNAGADWDGVVSSALEFWVIADDGAETTPSPLPNEKLVLAGINSGTDPDFGSYSLTLSDRLWVGLAEVDKALWDEVYNWAVLNGYDFDNVGDAEAINHPVVAINWYDSVKWCNARSEKEGLLPGYKVGGLIYRTGIATPVWMDTEGYRLPTVEEWQFLARGSRSGSRFPWGNQITHSEANYYSVASAYDVSPTRGWHPDYLANWPGTNPAGDFVGNGFGLLDMVGNVWEWCWDASLNGRYLAGGSWNDSSVSARCASVLADAPGNSRFTAGFRVVRSAADTLPSVVPAAVDTRDYTLVVQPSRGNPQPSVGTHLYPWRTAVTLSVDSSEIDSGLIFVSTGWSGTGSVPATGTTNWAGAVVLDELVSSITWNWVTDFTRDSDGDLMPDYWELGYFNSITNAVAGSNADGDQHSNLGEFIAGTDPTNAASFFAVSQSVTADGYFVVEWNSISNRIYTVQLANQLTNSFVNANTEIEYPQHSYTNMAPNAAGFYKVNVQLK